MNMPKGLKSKRVVCGGRVRQVDPPSEELQGYEEQLREWARLADSIGITDYQEPEAALIQRSYLQLALKEFPNGLTRDERKKLKELDALLKAHQEALSLSCGDLTERRRWLGFPPSHWWWRLGKDEGRNGGTKEKRLRPKRILLAGGEWPIQPPNKELAHYERQLQEWVRLADSGSTDWEEPNGVLIRRSNLQLALKEFPNVLTAEESKKLKELDRLLKAHKDALYASVGDVTARRRRIGFPASHWWWRLRPNRQRQSNGSERRGAKRRKIGLAIKTAGAHR